LELSGKGLFPHTPALGASVHRVGGRRGGLLVVCGSDEINKILKKINYASPGLSNKCLLSHML